MAKYSLGVNHAKQNKIILRLKIILLVIGGISILFGIVVAIDTYLNDRIAEQPSKITEPVKSVIAPSIEVFSSPFFKFQTDRNWSFVSSESTETKYVYRRGSTNLVSAILTVYINSTPSDLQTTRVLPVTLSTKDKLLIGTFVTDHCREKLPKSVQDTKGEEYTTQSSISFLCDVDGTIFTVLAGLENSSTVMNLKRSDGTNADYVIMYRDLRFKAEPREFVDIINSFQIR